jgi:hypothetical protein
MADGIKLALEMIGRKVISAAALSRLTRSMNSTTQKTSEQEECPKS